MDTVFVVRKVEMDTVFVVGKSRISKIWNKCEKENKKKKKRKKRVSLKQNRYDIGGREGGLQIAIVRK